MLLSHGSWMIRMLAPVGTVPTTTGVGKAANGISASGTNLAVDLAAGFAVTCFSNPLVIVALGCAFAASSGCCVWLGDAGWCSFLRLQLGILDVHASIEPLRGPIWREKNREDGRVGRRKELKLACLLVKTERRTLFEERGTRAQSMSAKYLPCRAKCSI